MTGRLFASWLGVTCSIETTPGLTEQLATELAPVLSPTPPDADVAFHLQLDQFGRPPGTAMIGPPAQVALAELTRFVIDHSPLLCIHAGTVIAPHGTIAIPGVSGAGKTTLTAALLQRGFGYLSDEVLAIDRTTLAVGQFPRPLALDGRSWSVLGLDPAFAPAAGAEQLISPADLGPGGVAFASTFDVRDIVLPSRGAFAMSLQAVPRGQAVGELLSRAFNHYADAAASFHAVVALVRGARVWRLEYSNAPEAAELLSDRWLDI